MNCEKALMLKMAELDGEQAPSVEVDTHVHECETCRRELAAMQGVDALLREHVAVETDVTVWPQVRERIAAKQSGWRFLGPLVVALILFKVIAMSVASEPGLLLGIVPLLIAFFLFLLLRENPFRVNTELILEK